MNKISILNLPNPRKIRVDIDRNWLYTEAINSSGISSEEEGETDFTNINVGTSMGDNIATSTQPTYNEVGTSIEDQDRWDWVQNELWDMRGEQARQGAVLDDL